MQTHTLAFQPGLYGSQLLLSAGQLWSRFSQLHHARKALLLSIDELCQTTSSIEADAVDDQLQSCSHPVRGGAT